MEIALEEARCAAGGTVRGIVRGLGDHPEARGVTVALVHRARRMKDHAPVAERLEAAGHGTGEVRFALAVPPDALPTFEGRHYASAWSVETRLDVPRGRDALAEAPLTVTPAPRALPPEGRPVSAAARGAARFRVFAGIFLVADLAALAGLYAGLGSVPGAVALAFVAPALVTLLALVLVGLRPGPVEALEVSAPRAAWRLGEELPVTVRVEGDAARIAEIAVALRGEEVWVQSTGKSSHEVRAAFHEDARRIPAGELAAGRTGGRRWEREVRFLVPDAGPPSHGRHIAWSVEARARVPHRPDPAARLRLEVAGSVPRGGG
jgi:hypothetical protein